MTNRIETLKGFRDFLPEEAIKREWLKSKIQKTFEKWGYDPLETPTIESLELFEGAIGEDEKLFYKFQDPGGRDVALRYDQTVPICRVVGQYNQQLGMPFRRYQIQPVFRAEKPQKGRYREFLQCDADIFGVESAVADAEVIALSLDIYKEIGFKDVKVLINDRALMSEFPYEAIVAIDKIEKIGEDGVIKDMATKGISEEDAKGYLEKVRNLEPNETIKTILNYLKAQGFDENWYEFAPTIARSFAYSTGPIWEVIIPGFKGSVLGGERYDELVKKYTGQKISGTGFAVGFDRTLEAAKELGLIPNISTKTNVLVTIFNEELVNESAGIAKELRELGVNVEIFPDPNKKLGKQFKYADKKGIEYVVVVGPDEIESKTYILKNLKSGEEDSYTKDGLIKNIK